MIRVWEDGFCDFCECERTGSGYIKGRFGADVFFKMSHEVYNFGEGWELVYIYQEKSNDIMVLMKIDN